MTPYRDRLNAGNYTSTTRDNNTMTVAELREALKAKGITPTGNKEELQERLDASWTD